jgi:hypothetical protein
MYKITITAPNGTLVDMSCLPHEEAHVFGRHLTIKQILRMLQCALIELRELRPEETEAA